jgi:D-threo-aldose 1-dehydrogenase
MIEIPGDFWREMREQKLVADDAPLPIDLAEEALHGARIR